MDYCVAIVVGYNTMYKYRRRAREGGYAVTARAMRKHGISLEMALLILFGKEERL